MKEFVIRVSSIIFLLISSTLFPFWVVGFFGLIMTFIFDNFFEIIVIGMVYDIVFHIPGTPWYVWGMHTVTTVVVYTIIVIIQKNTRKPQQLL